MHVEIFVVVAGTSWMAPFVDVDARNRSTLCSNCGTKAEESWKLQDVCNNNKRSATESILFQGDRERSQQADCVIEL